MHTFLHQACERGELRALDLQLGIFLEKLSGRSQPELLLAGTLAAAAVGNGHVCLPLDHITWPEAPYLPGPIPWRHILLASSVVGQPGETAPLILDDHNRLYLYRFYNYEQQIADFLRQRATQITIVDKTRAGALLKQLFPESRNVDFQQIAAAMSLLKPLLIISGGPGTGKTYTVARILALSQALQEKPLRIGLAAPTGKAAIRLEESIRKAKQTIEPHLAEAIPEQAQTLHRLLGFQPGGDDFRYNRTNPIPLDLLILDEASMIDIVLMAALVRGLPTTTRLILLGDRNQLASVEAGSLFADLCGTEDIGWSPVLRTELTRLTGIKPLPEAASNSTMTDAIIQLRASYRFREQSGIHTLATAVNNGSLEEVTWTLGSGFSDLEAEWSIDKKREIWLRDKIIQGFHNMLTASSLQEAYHRMESFRLLCAVRRGPAGVDQINTLAETLFSAAGCIAEQSTDWYKGKPIIIRRNHYEMQLFNGDTGIVWPDGHGRLRAWFMRSDNTLYPISPARLPEYDTAYAITIHKAQGSEFDNILLLLPEEDSRVLSRELLYTGITRARSKLTLCSTKNILAKAVDRQTRRHSGLQDKLWQKIIPNYGQDNAH